jgi:hypothetical protein
METVRPQTLQSIKNLYEFMNQQKDPTDNRVRLFSYEMANATNSTNAKTSHYLSVLVGLECIQLIKRSSGSYYPSVYELLKPPTTTDYLKYRERAAGRGALRIAPSQSDRLRMDVEELKARIQKLENTIQILLGRQLENE